MRGAAATSIRAASAAARRAFWSCTISRPSLWEASMSLRIWLYAARLTMRWPPKRPSGEPPSSGSATRPITTPGPQWLGAGRSFSHPALSYQLGACERPASRRRRCQGGARLAPPCLPPPPRASRLPRSRSRSRSRSRCALASPSLSLPAPPVSAPAASAIEPRLGSPTRARRRPQNLAQRVRRGHTHLRVQR